MYDWRLYLFARVTITKHQGLGSKNRNLFLTVLKAKNPRSGYHVVKMVIPVFSLCAFTHVGGEVAL